MSKLRLFIEWTSSRIGNCNKKCNYFSLRQYVAEDVINNVCLVLTKILNICTGKQH